MDSRVLLAYFCGMENAIPQTVIVREVPIELCQLLKFAGLTGTGGEAKLVIAEGLVLVNGETETRKRKKILEGDIVTYADQSVVVGLAPR